MSLYYIYIISLSPVYYIYTISLSPVHPPPRPPPPQKNSRQALYMATRWILFFMTTMTMLEAASMTGVCVCVCVCARACGEMCALSQKVETEGARGVGGGERAMSRHSNVEKQKKLALDYSAEYSCTPSRARAHTHTCIHACSVCVHMHMFNVAHPPCLLSSLSASLSPSLSLSLPPSHQPTLPPLPLTCPCVCVCVCVCVRACVCVGMKTHTIQSPDRLRQFPERVRHVMHASVVGGVG
jgi:hypothetical protein